MRATLTLLGLTACFGPRYEPRLEGDTCGTEVPCADGLVCAADGTCKFPGEPGTLLDGETCLASAQCALGLVCAADGTCAPDGDPGTAGFGDACETDADCVFGLGCAEDGTCRGLELPLWAGADCPDPELEEGPFRPFFEVPGDEALADFYRLPFPNDARVDDAGVIDVSGHPGPGVLIDVVGDVVGEVLRTASLDSGGFGNNQAVFFRFSGRPDLTTFDIGMPPTGTVAVVDVTAGAPEYGAEPAFRLQASTGRGAYICHNWLAVHPLDGQPWLPGHTYAILIGRNVLDDGGATASPDADFEPMLAIAAPTDARLRQAWEAFAPLRAWLSSSGLATTNLAGASVFTVQDPHALVERLRARVETLDVPPLHDAVLCGGGSDPFADGSPDRGCQAAAGAGYAEVQALVDLPQLQEGLPPFKDHWDGGAIDFRGVSIPVARTEAVHVSFAIPDGPMPEGGWPVILYGHGTGGNYTSGIREGLADELVDVTVGDTTARFMLVGFDAPMHGPRAHPENFKAAWLEVDPDAYEPDVLFFNPLNPRAARNNALQQVVDLMGITRLLAGLDLPAASSPTGEDLRVDPSRIYYLGHSQGGVVGATFLAHTDRVRAAVLSGAGGLTIQSLLHKTSPHDLPAALRVGLADPDITRVHPLLNIAQQIAEPADAVNHARLVFFNPLDGDPARHVLQLYGVGDTYSPDETQYALARALGVQQVPGGSAPLDRLAVTTLPATGNVAGTTAVVHLYEAQGRDAHFVLFDRPDTIHHVRTFFASAARNGTPTVSPL